jgi:uncharacterized protein YlaI
MAFQHIQTSLHRLYQSRFLRWPEGRLWVLRVIRLLKNHLNNRPIRIFQCPRCRKWVRIDFRTFETSFHRLHQSRFLRLPEEDCVFKDIGLLKTLVNRPYPSLFSMSRRHKMSSHGLDKSFHRHHIGLILTRTHGQLWVHRVIHLLKTTLKLLHPSPFFGCAVCRKWDGMAFWQREFKVVLRRPEGR